MNALSSDARLPLYQRLHEHLTQKIASNRWAPGDAISTQAALSTEYQLSTGTVRKAVDALVNEGILERQQGRGTFVRRPQFQSSLFRFFRFQTAAGERQAPQSRILSIEPVAAPQRSPKRWDYPPHARYSHRPRSPTRCSAGSR